MPFQPDANQQIEIDGVHYRVAEHPAAPGMAYGQQGRAATVYQLIAGAERRALKVFKPRFQVPALVALAERLAQYADLPGLAVCRRTVLTARRHPDLLESYPDLTYSVLMPWVAGPTWMDVLLDGRVLTPEQSLALARSLADVLAGMEEQGLAHGDLSAPNVLLPTLANSAFRTPRSPIELVDVEQMYGPELKRPDLLPAGSPGYGHPEVGVGRWNATIDRFAGAVLLAEMLGWCDARVRAAAWGESYFDPAEMQQPGPRAHLLAAVLEERWGARVAEQFGRAWPSASLADCPTFGAWLASLPRTVPAARLHPVQVPAPLATVPAAPQATAPVLPVQTLDPPDSATLAALFDDGLAAYRRGDWARATELLGEVERGQPGYARGRDLATWLLEDAQRRLRAPAQRSTRPGWIIGAAALLLAALLVGALLVAQIQAVAGAQTHATQTAQTILASATAETQLSATAQARQATTQTAQAKQTVTVPALTTAQTQATATAQAQQTATNAAQASASKVVAEATGTALAVVSSTRAAEKTMTNVGQQANTATAFAQATNIALIQQAADATVLAARQATEQAMQTVQAGATARAKQATATTRPQVPTRGPAPTTTRLRPTATSGQAAPRPTQPPPGVVPIPQLLAPSDGAEFDNVSQITLRISQIDYPTPYHYVYEFDSYPIGENTGCENDVLGWNWSSPTLSLGEHVSSSFRPGNTYCWRVWVFVGADWSADPVRRSDYSPWRTFTIKTAPGQPTPIPFTVTVPVPRQLSPSDGAHVGLDESLIAAPVAGSGHPIGYSFCLALPGQQRCSIFQRAPVQTTPSIPVSNFNSLDLKMSSGQTYGWAVSAFALDAQDNVIGLSKWSPLRSLTIK